MTREAAIAAQLASEWHLELRDVLPGATCSHVVGASDGLGQDLVLKVPMPHAEERLAASVVAAFSMHGGIELQRHDLESGATLMPRLRPGKNLADAALDDLAAVDVSARLILQLRGAPDVEGIPLETFFADFEPTDALGHQALAVANHLFATTQVRRVLHGDLHHFNVLRNGDDWLAIDPKGIVGDPAYEVAAFMRNPVGEDLSPSRLHARLVRFSELLGDPVDRLWGWSFAQTVRSYAWCEEDGDFHAAWRSTAESLWALRSIFGPSIAVS